MQIKEIREMTGLTQYEFGRLYGIPISTLKKWEADRDSSNYRRCPEYVEMLLKKAVETDFSIK